MIDLLEPLTSFWWTQLAPIAIQGALLLMVVAIVDLVLPRRTWPELRATLWLLAMVKLVLPPTLASPIGLLDLTAAAPFQVSAADETAVRTGATLVAAAWLAITAVLTSLGIRRWRRLTAAWRSSSATVPDWLTSLAQETARQVGLRRTPAIYLTELASSPFVAGLWRPAIYLGPALTTIPRQHLHHALLHEMAHVRRRDLQVAAVCAALNVVFWFHPLVWIARWRLAALREPCCDRTVARLLGDRQDGYYHTLLFFARRSVEPERPPSHGIGLLGAESRLLGRLRSLRQPIVERPWLRRLITAAVIAVMVTACMPMARSAHRGTTAVAELIERPPGCLTLRYMVFKRLAEARAAEATDR